MEAIRVGGEFSAVYSFESDSEEERASLQAQLQLVAHGYGSGSAAFTQAMEQISKHTHLRVKIVRNGTSEIVPEDNIPALIAYAKSFPTKINKQTARPIELIRRDYQTLRAAIPLYRNEEGIIDKWAAFLGSANEALADLDFAAKNLKHVYPPIDAASVQSLQIAARAYIDNLTSAANNCGEAPATCSTLALSISAPTFDIPGRAQTTPIDPTYPGEQLIGVVGPNEIRTIVILGQWQAWDNGPIWPPERCCFDIIIQRDNGLREDSDVITRPSTITP